MNGRRMDRLKKTQRRMTRIHVTSSALCYVHPAYRRFVTRKKIRQRLVKKRNIALATKIRNRWLHHRVLPRVAPFLCSKCGFATAILKKIEDHWCMKKNNSVNDLERDIKVAQMGARSRCKDAMAVLERMPNPQTIRLPKICILENEPSTIRYQIDRLSSLAYSSLQKSKRQRPAPRYEIPCLDYTVSEEPQSSKDSSSGEQNETIKVALYCTACERLFHSNHSYDEHLQRRDCLKVSNGPVLVETDADTTVPVEYKIGYRMNNYPVINEASLQCTKCQVTLNEFETVGKFHEHILKCGRHLAGSDSDDR